MSNVVDPAERVRELGGPYREVTYNDKVTYSFDHGYETYRVEIEGGGASEYRGVFHPNNGMCETGTSDGRGVCRWCGHVWH